MKLEIKLKDPKYCDGCPCYEYDLDADLQCGLYGFPWGDKKLFKDGKLIRPQHCIEENGE